MEDEGGGTLSDYEQVDEKSVVLIQALIRGALVRKWIREVKETYIQVLSDIEKKQNMCVEWDKPVSLPKVYKRRHKTTKLRSTKDKTNNQQQIESSSKNFRPTQKESVIRSVDENLEKNQRIPRFSTVETQTSFIVLNNGHASNDKNSRDTELPAHEQAALIENNFNDYDRNSNKDKLGNMHLSLEDEIGCVDTESLKSDSLKLDHENLYANKQLPLNVANLAKFEASKGYSKEDILSLTNSHRSSYTDEEKTTAAFQAKPQDDVLTKIEAFEAIDSTRSEGSEISNKSANTMKERLISSFDKAKNRNELSNENISSSKVVDDLNLSDIDERPSPGLGPYSNRSESRRTSKYSMDRNHEEDNTTRIKNNDKSQTPNRTKTFEYADRCEDGPDIEQGRNKSPVSDRSETSVKSQRSDSSHRSGRSQKSNRSLKSNRSQKSDRAQVTDGSKMADTMVEKERDFDSDGSQKSDKTNKSCRSHFSDRSRKPDDSHRSQRSRTAHSPREERHNDLKSPRPSSMSPVPLARKLEDLHSVIRPRISNQDSTTLTNVTSVWDSYNSLKESHDFEMPESLPDDTDKLKELRKNISMELLWVQQAINSRKNYLKLKNKM